MSEARSECASVKTAFLTANTSGAVYCEAQSERVRERGSKKVAFTLAEVLITLGIIGVVAAMTIPSLIQSYNRHIVETSLRKIYSTMNQAIKLSEEENGGRESWFPTSSVDADEQIEWLNKYIVPYFTGTQTFVNREGGVNPKAILRLNDGSILMLQGSNHYSDWSYLPKPTKKCLQLHYAYANGNCRFSFYWYPFYGNPNQWGYNFEPYAYPNGIKTSINTLKNDANYGCYNPSAWHGHCTELIRRNNWKIPKDYPYKVLTY